MDEYHRPRERWWCMKHIRCWTVAVLIGTCRPVRTGRNRSTCRSSGRNGKLALALAIEAGSRARYAGSFMCMLTVYRVNK